ncbi:hypothetical protein FHR74_002391 [Sphingomonas aerolata]|nr:hypothetical protein [Sphingomonas aerolata]
MPKKIRFRFGRIFGGELERNTLLTVLIDGQ